ncbi:SGNH/GDSL hydrolase family protein [Pseudalkalibacillus sp. NRS-1564]|uniref:SGNH/GDSL hydrolase family protein n=1 Tax=Pseudalkalibacillus sp. NRS-1564 TaxID=3233900 RepID=UPI003D27F7B6
MKWLFIGDSITDSGRNQDPEGLGYGYVRMIKEEIIKEFHVEIINKGVSGDRITDLESRWKRDVLALEPDLISISIGINDVWRQLDHSEMEQVLPSEFEEVYERLLNKVNDGIVQIVLMEPTIIEENIYSKGNQLLMPYVEIVRKLGVKFGAIVVPTHGTFLQALREKKDTLTTDGVHMTSVGNRLMADTWLKSYKDNLLR